jgi:tetratricopeptide (TPR) repeat protein
MVERYPLRETLTARLMLALFAGGRRADALAVFRRSRGRLIDELGIEPGAELNDLHRAILANDTGLSAGRRAEAADVPRLLPYDVPDFTGRVEDLAWLDRVSAGGTTTATIGTIGGIAGVGKTALAVHWAHLAAGRFPDGQLYVDLRGYGPDLPLTPMTALRRLLHAVGVADTAIPQDADEASALYRSTLSGRRVLVLLDNAATVEQVRPLIPVGPGSFALVTSRDRLSGLVAREGARRHTLDILSGGAARQLLCRIIGADRVGVEPDAVDELIHICGGLPLAIRIAAALLDGRPGCGIGEYVAGLGAGARLPAFAVEGDPQGALLAVFDFSYRALRPAEQSTLRLLGCAPGADVTVPAVAALTGRSAAEVVTVVDRLVDQHLLHDAAVGRYTMHDLIREYAHHLATMLDGRADREAALQRLLAWQLGHVEAADALLFPTVLKLEPRGAAASFADPPAAMRWLDLERANLVAGVRQAVGLVSPDASWSLLSGMRGYWQRVRASDELHELAGAVLSAARQAKNRPAQAIALLSAADAHMQRGEYQEAADAGLHCRDVAGEDRWFDAQIAGLNVAGTSYALLGRLHLAAELLADATGLLDTAESTYRRSTTLNRLGMVHGLLGNIDLAVQHMARSVNLARAENGGQLGLTTPLSYLAVNRRLQGRHDLALAAIRESLEGIEGFNAFHTEALLRLQLAKILRDTGELHDALTEIRYVLDVIEPTTDLTSRIHAHLTHGSILAELGDGDGASGCLHRSLRLARDAHNDHNIAEALIALAAVRLRYDGPEDLLGLIEEAHAVATTNHFRLLRGQALDVWSAVMRQRGQWAEAAELAEQTQRLYREAGHRPAPNPVSWLPTLSWP